MSEEQQGDAKALTSATSAVWQNHISVPDTPKGFTVRTTLPGNANFGHVYGTDLTAADKADLLAYLLTL